MEARSRTAERLKQRFRWLQSFTDEELTKISMCEADEPLQQGQEYFDLSSPERGPIPGDAGQRVPEGSCYVPRSSINSELWRKLIEPRTRS